jgi:hypothetical protein
VGQSEPMPDGHAPVEDPPIPIQFESPRPERRPTGMRCPSEECRIAPEVGI